MGCGVTGNTADSGSVVGGSIPPTPATRDRRPLGRRSVAFEGHGAMPHLACFAGLCPPEVTLRPRPYVRPRVGVDFDCAATHLVARPSTFDRSGQVRVAIVLRVPGGDGGGTWVSSSRGRSGRSVRPIPRGGGSRSRRSGGRTRRSRIRGTSLGGPHVVTGLPAGIRAPHRAPSRRRRGR